MKQHQCDLIFSTFGPASNHLVAWTLKKICKKPWIADFRDVWTTNKNMFFPTPLHRKLQQYLEKQMIRSADLITSVGEHINQDLRHHAPNSDKFVTVTNGFDPEMIDEVRKESGQSSNQTFTIGYMGAFYGDRCPDAFFTSIEQLIDERRIEATQIRIKFVSNLKLLPDKFRHIRAITDLKPLCSQKEALKIISDASTLLVMVEEEMKDHIVNAKIFDYMALQKPILAIIPKTGVCSEYLRPLPSVYIASPSSLPEIKQSIIKLYDDWKQNKVKVHNPADYIDRFNAYRLAGCLADQFNLLVKNDA